MTVVLSLAAKKSIDAWLKKYPPEQKQSGLLHALTVVQAENGGWLSEACLAAVAAYLGLSKMAVYEVARFYSLFELNPVGRHIVYLCNSVSCVLQGSDKIIHQVKKKLNIECGQTTPDGRFTLKEVSCLAACGGAPVMRIGEQYYENLTPERLDDILEALK